MMRATPQHKWNTKSVLVMLTRRVAHRLSGVAEQGVHRMHVHPQFFGRRKEKLFWNFPFFDFYATVHPQFLALCAIPAWYQLATEMVEQRPIYFQQDWKLSTHKNTVMKNDVQ